MGRAVTYVDLFGVETEPPGRRRRTRKHAPNKQTALPVACETVAQRKRRAEVNRHNDARPNPLAPCFLIDGVAHDSATLFWLGEHGQPNETEVSAAELIALLNRGPAAIADPAPYVRGSATSEAAARRLSSSGRLTGKRDRVLREILTHWGGGLTDNELTAYMVETHGWSVNTARPRRIELTRAGWLEDSGQRRNGGIVWIPTDAAWAWWRQSTNEGK